MKPGNNDDDTDGNLSAGHDATEIGNVVDFRGKSGDPTLTKARAAALIYRPSTTKALMRWLWSLCIPPCDRSDVAGDVWLACVASWHTYNPAIARPERWLNRIAVHIASHYRDRARHRREIGLSDLAFGADAVPYPFVVETSPLGEHLDVVDPAPSADAVIEGEEDRTLVRRALDALPHELRDVIVQHDIEGIPMSRISETRGIPLSTLYKHRARAFGELRAMVKARLAQSK